MPARYSKYSRGVSLIEIILALALFSVIVTSVFGAQWQIGGLFSNNTRIISALHVADQKLLKFLDAGAFDIPSPNPLSITDSFVIKPFTRCENVIESQSTWRTGWRSTSTVSNSYISSDLAGAKKYGKDCGGQPKQFVASNFILRDTIELSYPATAVDISKNVAFVTLKPASESDPDLATVSLPTPHQISFLNFGTGGNKIDAVENYAFIAHNSTSTQIVSLKSLVSPNPTLIATSTLPGVAGERPEGVSISYFDSKIYVGTKRTAGREFNMYNVSNPALPVWLGNFEVNHNINDISVKDGLAFLATSGNIHDLIVLDVHDPTKITTKVTVDLLGNEDGKSISVAGNFIFLGRYKGLASGHDELYLLKYEINPTDNSLSITALDTGPTSADINALAYAGGFVFVATSNPQKELQIFKLNDENKLIPVSSADLPNVATGIDYQDGILAVTAGTKLYMFNQHE